MKKIPTIFQRNEDDHLVRDEVTPGAEWVFAGEGVATKKIDGTACMIQDGKFFKRYTQRQGKKLPKDFVQEGEVDPNTGLAVGWVPVTMGPEDQHAREGLASLRDRLSGTYELIGPKIQRNPYGLSYHMLVPHNLLQIPGPERNFEAIRDFVRDHWMEGIVWHHPDGRMAKIKRRDFRIFWP